MIRTIAGTIAGIAAAILIILGVEALSDWLYPMALTVDSDDPAAIAALIAGMPLPAKLLVVGGWFAGAFGGAWLALRITDRRWAGWIAAAFVAAGGIVILVEMPHPLWMQAMALVAPFAGGWLARRLHRAPYPGEPLLG